jgi:flagellar motor switch protein FliM
MADQENNAPSDGGAKKELSQNEIDNLLGVEGSASSKEVPTGILAMLDRALQSYERLPMLEVVFDRFVRILTTTLRNFTSDNVDIDIRSISSLRFEDYINSIPVPAVLAVFKAVEWENFGIITVDGPLVYSLVDVLFGGRKVTRPIRNEGRPYTTIEQGIIHQLADLMLLDLGAAFDPLSPTTFQFERMETTPRFATIARPGDPVVLLQLRIDMDERGGNVEVLIPHATMEPIRALLLNVFMGEKFGRDSAWDESLQQEVHSTSIELEAVLDPKLAVMQDIMKLKVGSTIIMENFPGDDIILHSNGIKLLSGKLGKIGDNMAVSISGPINKSDGERL